MSKVFSISLGCAKNRVDTERLLALFGPDYQAAAEAREAEIVLINTCSFIRPAVEEALRTIIDTAEELRAVRPKPLLAVAGCLVARYGKEQLAREIPEVDLWLDVPEMADWPELLAALPHRLRLDKTAYARGGRLLSTGPSYAYLKISDGCAHRCAYCLIPSIRGRLTRSRPLEELLREAEDLLDRGVSELVLVAQDLCAYGRDIGRPRGLPELLAALCLLPGLKRLRMMYLYPTALTDDFLDFLGALGPPLLPYFDIPLQHSHPRMLELMRRPAAPDPRALIARVRAHFPRAALRTTLITGFPGETEEYFADMLDFVRTAAFNHLGVFVWQAEEGTAAFGLPERVERRVAAARRKALLTAQRRVSRRLLRECVGREMEVLADRPSPEWPGLYIGRTWFQAPEVDGVTYLSGEGVKAGELLAAEIIESKDYDLVAMR